MQPLIKTILSRIYGHGRGWTFTPNDFADIADPNLVSAILSRLKARGKIRRLAHGLYDYPRKHSQLGLLYPSVEQVVQALSRRNATIYQPSGAYAANLLGLSEQVPAKVLFLTNGKPRKIKLANLTIELRRRSERNLILAGTISGLIVEALRHLGKHAIDERAIQLLTVKLPKNERKRLQSHIRFAPIWMRSYLLYILGEKQG